jgi:hypothetical protein
MDSKLVWTWALVSVVYQRNPCLLSKYSRCGCCSRTPDFVCFVGNPLDCWYSYSLFCGCPRCLRLFWYKIVISYLPQIVSVQHLQIGSSYMLVSIQPGEAMLGMWCWTSNHSNSWSLIACSVLNILGVGVLSGILCSFAVHGDPSNIKYASWRYEN